MRTDNETQNFPMSTLIFIPLCHRVNGQLSVWRTLEFRIFRRSWIWTIREAYQNRQNFLRNFELYEVRQTAASINAGCQFRWDYDVLHLHFCQDHNTPDFPPVRVRRVISRVSFLGADIEIVQKKLHFINEAATQLRGWLFTFFLNFTFWFAFIIANYHGQTLMD